MPIARGRAGVRLDPLHLEDVETGGATGGRRTGCAGGGSRCGKARHAGQDDRQWLRCCREYGASAVRGLGAALVTGVAVARVC